MDIWRWCSTAMEKKMARRQVIVEGVDARGGRASEVKKMGYKKWVWTCELSSVNETECEKRGCVSACVEVWKTLVNSRYSNRTMTRAANCNDIHALASTYWMHCLDYVRICNKPIFFAF